MTGRSRSGKMSARIRLTAKNAVSATAMTATRMVTGRRRAARISHIGSTSSRGRAQVGEKRGQRALRRRLRQQRAPHVDPRELILYFRLRQEALGVGDFADAAQP